MSIIAVGERAAPFTLKDQHGEPVTPSAEEKKRIVLSFHPLAWTALCAEQMKALEKNRGAFHKERAVAFGVSVDPSPSKLAWAKSLRIKETRLLSDFWPHGGVAKQFGIFREEDGFSERAVIILDEKREVRFAKVYPLSELPDLGEIVDALKAIGG
jgi:peroxiredoxin